jgi:tetratricopeptide (TPR) repeat protein
MPKLTFLQAIAVVAFLAFYGFAVFALTRDYYIRHSPSVATVSAAPHPATEVRGRPGGPTLGNESSIPAAVAGTNPVLLSQQADELFGQSRYAEAIPIYRRILELSGDDLDAHNDLGLALHYTGQTAEALAVLAQGTAKGPQFQRIWLTYGYVQSQAGEGEGAVASLTKARDLGPDTGVGKEAARLLGVVQKAPPPKP